jgi:hypothetical protein
MLLQLDSYEFCASAPNLLKQACGSLELKSKRARKVLKVLLARP